MSDTCRVCGNKTEKPIFSAEVLGKSVDFYECTKCGYVQTENPYWLGEAYESVINDSDTGLMLRNLRCARTVLGTLSSLGNTRGRVVDCAGGYGILTRLLRDIGIDAFWSDPYCRNLVAMGFEHKGTTADLVTAFEAFEHFVTPVQEINTLFEIAPNLLISTILIPTPTPPPDEWWYYGLSHGQHVGFFRVSTLHYIAEKFGKHLITDGVGTHLFVDKPISKMKWRFNILVGRFMPWLLARKISSRVQSDHEMMNQSK